MVFLDLAPFHFLIGQSRREGELPTSLRPFTIEQVDAGEYPSRVTTDSLRSQLMRRDGINTAAILKEIANRLTEPPPPPQPGSTEPGGGPRPTTDPVAPVASDATPAVSETAPAEQPAGDTRPETPPQSKETASAAEVSPPLRPIRPRKQPRKPSQTGKPPTRKKPPE